MPNEQGLRRAGEIIFNTVSTAVKEAGAKMSYNSWESLDERIKINYIEVVQRILDTCNNGKVEEEIQIEEPVISGVPQGLELAPTPPPPDPIPDFNAIAKEAEKKAKKKRKTAKKT